MQTENLSTRSKDDKIKEIAKKINKKIANIKNNLAEIKKLID